MIDPLLFPFCFSWWNWQEISKGDLSWCTFNCSQKKKEKKVQNMTPLFICKWATPFHSTKDAKILQSWIYIIKVSQTEPKACQYPERLWGVQCLKWAIQLYCSTPLKWAANLSGVSQYISMARLRLPTLHSLSRTWAHFSDLFTGKMSQLTCKMKVSEHNMKMSLETKPLSTVYILAFLFNLNFLLNGVPRARAKGEDISGSFNALPSLVSCSDGSWPDLS